MKKRSYDVSYGGFDATATYFDEHGVGRREPLGEIFDKVSDIHKHTDHEVFFILDGEMELVLEDNTLSFRNCAVIVPAGVGHYTLIDAERLFVLYFSSDEGIASLVPLQVRSFEIDDDVRFFVEKLSAGADGDDSFHYVSLLFSSIVRRLAPEVYSKRGGNVDLHKYAFEIDDYIEHHYSEQIRLAELARHLHLCEKQVSRVIKREYGCSFSALVNQKRLAVASMMLRHTDITVSAIARTVGFENDNYFYRVFKEKYGSTPNEYRNQKNGS